MLGVAQKAFLFILALQASVKVLLILNDGILHIFQFHLGLEQLILLVFNVRLSSLDHLINFLLVVHDFSLVPSLLGLVHFLQLIVTVNFIA